MSDLELNPSFPGRVDCCYRVLASCAAVRCVPSTQERPERMTSSDGEFSTSGRNSLTALSVTQCNLSCPLQETYNYSSKYLGQLEQIV